MNKAPALRWRVVAQDLEDEGCTNLIIASPTGQILTLSSRLEPYRQEIRDFAKEYESLPDANFADANELAAWLDKLYVLADNGVTITNQKWAVAQRLIETIRALDTNVPPDWMRQMVFNEMRQRLALPSNDEARVGPDDVLDELNRIAHPALSSGSAPMISVIPTSRPAMRSPMWRVFEMSQEALNEMRSTNADANGGADLREVDGELIPEWAIRRASGLELGAQLPTRDGRRTGNGHIIEIGTSMTSPGMPIPVPLYTVLTDAGNRMRMSGSEVFEVFYPPTWVGDVAQILATFDRPEGSPK